MVVPFQRIMQYVKKNQKPSIIAPQPNDAILANEDEDELKKEVDICLSSELITP